MKAFSFPRSFQLSEVIGSPRDRKVFSSSSLAMTIAGVAAVFTVVAWRRFAKRRYSRAADDFETAEPHHWNSLAISEPLDHVADAPVQYASDELSHKSLPTNQDPQTTCDYCGKPLSPTDDEVVYRRFEGGSFNSFCSARCHIGFLMKAVRHSMNLELGTLRHSRDVNACVEHHAQLGA